MIKLNNTLGNKIYYFKTHNMFVHQTEMRYYLGMF